MDSKKILVVEDSKLLNDFISAQLEKNTYSVTQALNGKEAYEALKALTRTNQQMTQETIQQFIAQLNVSAAVKAELMAITPLNYTGM